MILVSKNNICVDYRMITTISLLVVLFCHSVVSHCLQPHELQHARLPCPSPSPGACSNSCPFSGWCLPTVSSSGIPFFSYLWSFPASGCFQMSQLFTLGGKSIGASASASVPSMHIQDCNYDITKTLVAYGFLSLNLKDFFIYLISCFTLIF